MCFKDLQQKHLDLNTKLNKQFAKRTCSDMISHMCVSKSTFRDLKLENIFWVRLDIVRILADLASTTCEPDRFCRLLFINKTGALCNSFEVIRLHKEVCDEFKESRTPAIACSPALARVCISSWLQSDTSKIHVRSCIEDLRSSHGISACSYSEHT